MTYGNIYLNLRFVRGAGGSRHFVISHDLTRKFLVIIKRYTWY